MKRSPQARWLILGILALVMGLLFISTLGAGASPLANGEPNEPARTPTRTPTPTPTRKPTRTPTRTPTPILTLTQTPTPTPTLTPEPSKPSTLWLPFVARDLPNPCGSPQTTWQGGTPNGVSIDALLIGPGRNGKVIYAGAASAPGLHISRDGGATWPESLSLPPVLSFATDPLVSTIYAGTFGGGIYRSINEGASWDALPSPNATVWSLLALQTSSSSFNLLAGTDAGVYLSASSGSSWNATSGLAGKIVYGLARNPANGDLFAATSGSGVYRSADGGASWNPTALTNGSVFALAVGTSNRLYAGSMGKAYMAVAMAAAVGRRSTRDWAICRSMRSW